MEISKTSNKIICQVTGRSWPKEYNISLKKCKSCKRLINTRDEPWYDGPICNNCGTRSKTEFA